MRRRIILHGALRRRFGKMYVLDVDTPGEVIRALGVQLKGFLSFIRHGEFRVLRGDSALDENELTMTLGTEKDFHIVPMAIGSKRNGLLKVILGVALIGVGFAVAGGMAGLSAATSAAFWGKNLIMFGAGMLLNGLGQMLSPTPTVDSSHEGAATKQSYTFGGAVNLTEEGNIVPVIYGTMWSGSVVISAGMYPEEVI